MPSIESLIKKYRIRPKKYLGQHFLIAKPTANKIVEALEIDKGDDVMEIGTGPGTMTGLIAARCGHLFAVEKDGDLLDIAKREHDGFDNITWIREDILAIDIGDLPLGEKKAKLIGNLPYNISSQIIFWMIENRPSISRAIVMLQKEVALRITAARGGKDYGILSVLSQSEAKCLRMFDVSAKSFWPLPEVTSSVILLDFEKGRTDIGDKQAFRTIVKAAFGKRRKTLKNSLLMARALGFSAKRLDEALNACKIEGTRRAETLDLDEFVSLSNELIEVCKI